MPGRSARLLTALALLLALPRPGRAEPYVTGTATRQADGTYLYEYTVVNPAHTGPYYYYIPTVHTFVLQGVQAENATNITQPSTWFHEASYRGLRWKTGGGGLFSGGYLYDGQSATFSFVSGWAPGEAAYSLSGPAYGEVGASRRFDWVDGWGTGGRVVAPVPEPASVVLALIAGTLFGVRQLRRRAAAGKRECAFEVGVAG